jgi:hypothetical protein
MANIDKYEPLTGGHRAQLAVAITGADLRVAHAVGLDANGRVVIGSGNTGVIGVLVLTKSKNVGDVVDVMQDGDIVEMEGLVAGTRYYGQPDGTISTVNTGVSLGWTVEAERLVVRMGR